MMRRHGIRHRLNLIIVGAIAIGLLATFAMFSVRDVQQRRGALLTELHSMADVIAFNAAAVIEFEDRTGAERLFGALAKHPDIIHAEMRSNGVPHVWLDTARIGRSRFAKEFPMILEHCWSIGLDPLAGPLPVTVP